MNVQEATRNPLHKLESRARLSCVKQRFGTYLVDNSIPEDFVLALYPFAATRPLCFFSSAALGDALRLFEQDSTLTLTSMQVYAQQISHGLSSILRKGTSWKDDLNPALKTPSDLIQFEQIWHPEYQRYSEHIFNNLLRLPLEILGRHAGKDYQSSL